jgi:general stress protein YciG
MEEGETLGKQGTASFSSEKLKEVSSKGGKASWAKGVAHKWTSEEATIAGKKGHEARRRKKDLYDKLDIE